MSRGFASWPRLLGPRELLQTIFQDTGINSVRSAQRFADWEGRIATSRPPAHRLACTTSRGRLGSSMAAPPSALNAIAGGWPSAAAVLAAGCAARAEGWTEDDPSR